MTGHWVTDALVVWTGMWTVTIVLGALFHVLSRPPRRKPVPRVFHVDQGDRVVAIESRGQHLRFDQEEAA